jgi:hypothetical protein
MVPSEFFNRTPSCDLKEKAAQADEEQRDVPETSAD